MEGKQGRRAEPADGDLAGHGDGGRVKQLFHAGADKGDAEQVSVVLVDDHAGAAGVAVGVQAGAGHRLARSMSTTRMRCPARSAW